MTKAIATRQETGITQGAEYQPIIDLVVNSLDSQHSKRAYSRAIGDFLGWRESIGNPPLTKALVNDYRALLLDAGLSPATINQRLSALRALGREAGDNGLLPEVVAQGIAKVKGIKGAGRRVGNWLTKAQAQELLDTPNVDTLKGKRDRAVLAVMLGCGLRRSEAANLTFAHVQMREARWVIVDLVGKRNRIRSIPMPAWAKSAIDAWTEAAGITEGRVFRPLTRGGNLAGDTMTPQAIGDVVRLYGPEVLPGLAAHDLRRTFSKLAHKGGAGLDQIQLSLGHASIQTTERYIGVDQSMTSAPCDVLGLE
ncbi:MAG: tyrosine-type recombinase/integrase [Planctomycetota bacterium]|jgi:integrase